MEEGFSYSGVGNQKLKLMLKVCFRLGEWNPQELTTKDFFTAAFTLFELVAHEEKTQIAGVTVVADIAGFGLKHLKYLEKCLAGIK